MRDQVRVVVQGGGRRGRGAGLARVLWAAAELTVTVGVVVLLLVVHQVWWTNRQAAAAAREEVQELESQWAEAEAEAEAPVSGDGDLEGGGVVAESPGVPSGGSRTAGGVPREAPARAVGGDAYAVLRVPRLGLVVPVAQGIDKRGVLDKGYAGHYPGTAAPGAPGNFALAGHRNTHGEPFRYVNRLRAGDELIVDVRGQRFVYVVGKTLAQTTERDTGVIAPVPRSLVKPDAGYGEPGAYITLTTCTPEYSSRYRLVVWGTLKSRLPTRSVSGGG
ncbi:class E sortase [Streptomyces sp. ADI95-16]|uniref:class E sortase n=1 Tax=Streptomyces sp. ADI95-16 TaxID=1522758 RepID=UPI000F3A9833|nr:class E sortase [Streptomyces sp. ADI95-16]